MSECKICGEDFQPCSSGLGSRTVCLSCTGANTTIEFLEQENADLRAKVEAAEKSIKRYKEITHRQYLRNIGVIEKMEKAVQERNNLQTEVDLLRTGYCDSYNKKSCKQQNDILQAQVIEYKDIAIEQSRKVTDLQAQVGVLQNSNDCLSEQNTGLINKITDLQAANAVLVGALELAHKYAKYPRCGAPEAEHPKDIVSRALSTTPAEAGGKVRGLVEAVEKTIAAFINTEISDNGFVDQFEQATCGLLEEALAKYRGGPGNE